MTVINAGLADNLLMSDLVAVQGGIVQLREKVIHRQGFRVFMGVHLDFLLEEHTQCPAVFVILEVIFPIGEMDADR